MEWSTKDIDTINAGTDTANRLYHKSSCFRFLLRSNEFRKSFQRSYAMTVVHENNEIDRKCMRTASGGHICSFIGNHCIESIRRSLERSTEVIAITIFPGIVCRRFITEYVTMVIDSHKTLTTKSDAVK